LENQLYKTTAEAIKFSEEVELLKREAIIAEASSDLAETQSEKLYSLVEALDFDDEESFAAKVATVKESYFSKKKAEQIIEESADDESAYESETDVAPNMERYLTALRNANK